MAGSLDSVLNIAATGLAAAGAQLSTAANNIANSDTPGYRAQRVDLVELSTGGVAVAGITRDPAPGSPNGQGQVGSNVDLATEAVNLIRAKTLYTANAAVVRTADELYGSLLDILDHHNGHRHHRDALGQG